MSEPNPVVIKFPPRPNKDKPLVLPRRLLRSPFEVSAAAAETQKTINALRSATRNPWGEMLNLDEKKVADLEKSLRQLAAKLDERERALQDLEAKLGERERELAETENLMKARESLIEASKTRQTTDTRQLSLEEMAAMEKLKAELDRQQAFLQEQRDALREREAFMEESETRLFEKVQAQQELETELEQREEDLRGRDRRLREREAKLDPQVAAALEAEKAAAKKFDEFNE